MKPIMVRGYSPLRWLFLLVVVIGGCVTLSNSSPLKPYYSLMEKQRWEEAAVGLSFFLENNPKSPYVEEATYLLGKVYLHMGNTFEASRTFEDYLKRWPEGRWKKEVKEKLSQIQRWMSKEKYSLKDMEEDVSALSLAYEKVLGKKVPPSQLYLTLGNIYWEEEKREEAIKSYKKALELDPSLKEADWLMKRIQKSKEGVSPPLLVVTDYHIRDIWETWRGEYLNLELENDRIVETIKKSKGVRVNGELVNKGEQTAYRVRLIVTAYDFYRRVLGTSMVFLGEIKPGGNIPFSVLIRDVRKEKVNHVEFLPLYQKKEEKNEVWR